MLNIAICDDDMLHRRHTAALILGMPEYAASSITEFASAMEFISSLGDGSYLPDIAVLDIEMDGMDGIELAIELNGLLPECQIIFLTGYISYATRVYDAEHVFFVLKSEAGDRLKTALGRAFEKRLSAASRHITVTANGVPQRLPWEQVQYLERVLRRTRIVTASGELWTSCPPSDILSQLDSRCYCQCHKSFYVNTAQLAAMLPAEFVLQSGLRVPISRNCQRAARESFLFNSGMAPDKM